MFDSDFLNLAATPQGRLIIGILLLFRISKTKGGATFTVAPLSSLSFVLGVTTSGARAVIAVLYLLRLAVVTSLDVLA